MGLRMIGFDQGKIGRVLRERGGPVAWLMSRLQAGTQAREQRKPRLALLDRISLGPRQSLALVETEGKRFLVGTSADGGPVFYPLDGRTAKTCATRTPSGLPVSASARVPW